jgi:hypothetical protein
MLRCIFIFPKLKKFKFFFDQISLSPAQPSAQAYGAATRALGVMKALRVQKRERQFESNPIMYYFNYLGFPMCLSLLHSLLCYLQSLVFSAGVAFERCHIHCSSSMPCSSYFVSREALLLVRYESRDFDLSIISPML